MPKKTFFNLPDDKRKRVIDGAKKAFSQNHYNAVTIDMIVANANIPKGSFYQYFENKDDLFKYIFKGIGTSKKDELIDELSKSKDSNFSETILQMIKRAERFENKDAEMVGLRDRFLKECPQKVKNEILSEVIPDSIDLFEKTLSIFINKGHFRDDFDVKTAAFMLTSVVINIEKYPIKDGEDYGDVLLKACKILEKGLLREQKNK